MTHPFDPQLAMDRYFDEELDPATFEQLRQWLEANPTAAAEFAQRAFLHSRLSMIHARRSEPSPRSLEEAGVELADEFSTAEQTTLSANATPSRTPVLGFLGKLQIAIHPTRHPARFFSFAAGLTALFWIVVLVLVSIKDRPQRGLEALSEASIVATITHLHEAHWEFPGRTFSPGARLQAGEELKLERGIVQLSFQNGARVVIEGPAAWNVVSREAMRLEHGKLLADVSRQAQGFTVATPTVSLIDLGTEFGVECFAEETDLHVFKGKVQVVRNNDAQDPIRVLTAGKAALFGNSPLQGFYVKEKEMNRAIYLGLAVVLTASSSQAGTILTQPDSPTAGGYGGAHWTLSDSGFNSAGEPMDSTVLVNSVSLKRRNGASGTVGNLYMKIFTGSAGGDGTFVGISDNTVDFNSLPGSSLGTWTFSGITLERDAVYSYVFGLANNSSQESSIAQFQVSSTNKLAGNLLDSSHDSLSGPNDPFVQISVENIPPIPEPSTGAAIGLGGMLVLSLGRRRIRRTRMGG